MLYFCQLYVCINLISSFRAKGVFVDTGELEGLHSSEIYEIDYKGPETHSSVPPPHRNHSARQKSLGLMGATRTQNKASIL